jgi:hypothetical protein
VTRNSLRTAWQDRSGAQEDKTRQETGQDRLGKKTRGGRIDQGEGKEAETGEGAQFGEEIVGKLDLWG